MQRAQPRVRAAGEGQERICQLPTLGLEVSSRFIPAVKASGPPCSCPRLVLVLVLWLSLPSRHGGELVWGFPSQLLISKER